MPALRARHPSLVLELAVDQRPFDLTRREADLAVRMGRPRDAGLVIRKLAEVAAVIEWIDAVVEGARGALSGAGPARRTDIAGRR